MTAVFCGVILAVTDARNEHPGAGAAGHRPHAGDDPLRLDPRDRHLGQPGPLDRRRRLRRHRRDHAAVAVHPRAAARRRDRRPDVPAAVRPGQRAGPRLGAQLRAAAAAQAPGYGAPDQYQQEWNQENPAVASPVRARRPRSSSGARASSRTRPGQQSAARRHRARQQWGHPSSRPAGAAPGAVGRAAGQQPQPGPAAERPAPRAAGPTATATAAPRSAARRRSPAVTSTSCDGSAAACHVPASTRPTPRAYDASLVRPASSGGVLLDLHQVVVRSRRDRAPLVEREHRRAVLGDPGRVLQPVAVADPRRRRHHQPGLGAVDARPRQTARRRPTPTSHTLPRASWAYQSVDSSSPSVAVPRRCVAHAGGRPARPASVGDRAPSARGRPRRR